MDQILKEILKTTYSLPQLKHRLRILKAYLSNKFFGGNLETLSGEETEFIASLPPAFFQQFSKDNISEIFSQMEAVVNKWTPLTLYLAFEPTDEALRNIGQKARSLFGDSLLLDIKYDPKLLAGAGLSWKGIYKDYSLRSRIEENKQKILDSFKKFLT